MGSRNPKYYIVFKWRINLDTALHMSLRAHSLMQPSEERLIHTRLSHVTSCNPVMHDRLKTNLCREVVEFTVFPFWREFTCNLKDNSTNFCLLAESFPSVPRQSNWYSLTAEWFLMELNTSLSLAVFSHCGVLTGFFGRTEEELCFSSSTHVSGTAGPLVWSSLCFKSLPQQSPCF